MNNVTEKSITLMAFSKGQVSKEAPDFKYYIGIGTAKIVGVNPTKAELEKIYGHEVKNDPVYVTEANLQDGTKVARVRVDFIFETEETELAPSLKLKASYFLTATHRLNGDKTKCQIIDKFGRTAWVTKEEFGTQAIPMSKNSKPLSVSSPYRMVWYGEEDLVNLLKTFLCIKNPMDYVTLPDGTKEWQYKSKEELADCEADFSQIEKYFKGDVSEIREIVGYQPDNKVQILVGVRTYDGKMFQDVFIQKVLGSSATRYESLKAALDEQKAAGRYKDTAFEIQPLQEYKVSATSFEAAPADMPFEATSDLPQW